MRLLLTADCVGGVWTYALDLARCLTATGHRVVVAVMGGSPTPDQAAAMEAQGVAGWEARPYKLEWMPGAGEDLAAAGEWLLGLAGRHRADVVHLNQFSFGALRWPCPALVVAHSDVVTWWRAVHGRDPDPAWDAYRARVTAGLAAADLVVAPTAAMLADLRAAYDFTAPARVIHNGRGFDPAPRDDRDQIAALGRVWDDAKNLATAARAARGLDWPLVIGGQGAVEGARCLGTLDRTAVANLLATSPVFVAPARYEPFGLAALEAGMAGCAPVLGDIPSLREVWGDAATFVAPDDAPALASALSALIGDRDLLRERQAAASRHARQFTAESMASAYASCYVRLAGTARDRVAS